ncbi:MAG: hypothetical protein ACI9HA_003669, partial [Dinoroseobacter sp.]
AMGSVFYMLIDEPLIEGFLIFFALRLAKANENISWHVYSP